MNVVTRTKPKAKISAAEMKRRRDVFEKVVGNSRMEGQMPSPEYSEAMELFIHGEIEFAEVRAIIDAKYQPAQPSP